MKKLLVVLVGALVLMSTAAFAQDSYYLDYFANNGTSPSVDQAIRIVNVGINGSPMTVPVGDICAQIYVFDNNQEMIACCGCNITPNGLASAWVRTQLTNNPLTKIVPVSGVIKVALMNNSTGKACDPTAPLAGASTNFGQIWETHLNKTDSNSATVYWTETKGEASSLGATEEIFLPSVCSFARYIGSGFGTCSCTNPGF